MNLPPFPAEYLDLPDDQLGLHLFAWWVGFQAERRGISPTQVNEFVVEQIRAATVDMDSDNAARAAVEKALRLVGLGDAARGGRLLRQYLQTGARNVAALDEARTGRRRQRRNAQQRRRDGLQALIEAIVGQNPEITQPQLLQELRSLERQGVIESVNDAEKVIEWCDEKRRDGVTPFSGLKDRLSRAKRRDSR